jgi:hypothetical protein
MPKAEYKTFSTLYAQAQICYFNVLARAYFSAICFPVLDLLNWFTIFFHISSIIVPQQYFFCKEIFCYLVGHVKPGI